LNLTDGTVRTLTSGSWPSWSPDGTKIVFQRETGQYLPNYADVELFTVPVATGIVTQLTNVPGASLSAEPAWSPDGQKIAYVKFVEGPKTDCWNDYVIAVIDTAGNELERLTCQTAAAYLDEAPAWSPDSAEVAFTRKKGMGQSYQLHKVNVAAKTITKLTDSPDMGYDEYTPTWASDGSAVAVSSGRDGDHDIWLVDSRGGGYLINLTNANPEVDAYPVFGK